VAIAVPRPDPAGMEADLFRPDAARPVPPGGPEPAAPENLTMAQALNRAHPQGARRRPESIVLGQDIATYGGAFKVTENLFREFGRSRVFNTPLAESACTGYAIGLALNGHRPIEEFQFADFATEAATQITLNAATMHFRSGASCPLVLRLPCGGGHLGSFHSQELESFFLSMPGLKALYPSNPQDAFNALLAASEDNNPVLLFEHKGLYRRGKHPVAWDPDYRSVWRPSACAAATTRRSSPTARRSTSRRRLRLPGVRIRVRTSRCSTCAASPRSTSRRSPRRSRGRAGSSCCTRAAGPTGSAPRSSPGSPRAPARRSRRRRCGSPPSTCRCRSRRA
jgi:hypothetical protein